MLQQQRASADRILPATIEGIADKIAPHPLFARLNRDAQFCTAQRCEIVCYPAGTVLMRQGETGSFACVVLEGEIDIFVEIPAGPIPMATAGRNSRLGGGQKFSGGKTVCNTALESVSDKASNFTKSRIPGGALDTVPPPPRQYAPTVRKNSRLHLSWAV